MASCLLHWAVCLLPLALFTGRSAYYTLLGALCFEADAQGRLVSIGSCPLPLTFAYGLMSAALDLIAHTSCMPQSAACASSLLPVAVRPMACYFLPFPCGLLPSFCGLLFNATKTLCGRHTQHVSEMLVNTRQGRSSFAAKMLSSQLMEIIFDNWYCNIKEK